MAYIKEIFCILLKSIIGILLAQFCCQKTTSILLYEQIMKILKFNVYLFSKKDLCKENYILIVLFLLN